MKTLKTQFRKNDLYYTLICRNDKVALFETRQDEDSVFFHYEVARIYIMPAHTAIGVDFEESEIITNNDQFQTDGRGSFRSLDNALKHYNKLSLMFVRDEYVEPNSTVDTEIIAECQPAGDNAL